MAVIDLARRVARFDVARLTIPTAGRERIVKGCAFAAALGWIAIEVLYALMLGPHINLLRTLAVGSGVGVFAGLLTGLLQWRLLRHFVRKAGWWIPATTLGYTLAGLVSSFVLYQAISSTQLFRSMLALEGVTGSAVAGTVVAVVQWTVLGAWVDPRRDWRSWVVPLTLGTALAPAATLLTGWGIVAGLTWALGLGSWPVIAGTADVLAGIAGGIVYGLFTAWGLRRVLPQPHESSPGREP